MKIKRRAQRKKSNQKMKKEKKDNLFESYDNIIQKDIAKDGNCFYRSLSYYYRETEEDYPEFRKLIVRYIDNNPGDLDITIAYSLFNCDIKMFILGDYEYKLFNDFSPDLNDNNNKEIINILFKIIIIYKYYYLKT